MGNFMNDEIAGLMIDGMYKGIPGGAEAFPLGKIAEKDWNVLRGDLPLPVALLRQSALDQNGAWMRAFLQATGVAISPHGKTTMSPQLFRRQLRDGAWAHDSGDGVAGSGGPPF